MTSKTKLLYKRSINSFLSFFKEKNQIFGNVLTFNYSYYYMEEALIKDIKEIIRDKNKIKIMLFSFFQIYYEKNT